MKKKSFLCCLLLLLVSFPSVDLSECSENSKWSRRSDLNSQGRVFIHWNFNAEEITMLMIGRTKGWIGIGFSPSGTMAGADLVLGWVKDQKPYIQDRYGIRNGRPFIDNIQSYNLLNGFENETHTSICWTRKLNNCDKQDFPLTNDTIRVIWALNDNDPVDLSYEAPHYHGVNRGTQSVNILQVIPGKPTIENLKTMDFVASDITIPKTADDTLYWCTHFTVPKASKPTHMIGIIPVISKGNEDILHHWILYECPEDVVKKMQWSFPKKGYNCFNVATFPLQNACITMINGWAVGDLEDRYFPLHVGHPFHSTNKNKYYMLQSHYSTKFMKGTRKDSSGARILYTDTLRTYETGIIGVGINVSPFQVIPPGQKEFTNVGVCSSECTQQTFPKDGIRVIGILYHSHLAGRKIRFRIFRDGVEQHPLFNDNYDFNFQTFVSVKELLLLPGDTLVSECVYDTTDRNYTTIGDFGTDQEMCLVFLFYYPSSNLTACVSYLQPSDVFKLTGVESIWPLPKLCSGSNCPSPYAVQGVPSLYATVRRPQQFNGMKLTKYIYQANWTQEKIDTLQKMYYNREHYRLCKNKDFPFLSSDEDRVKFPTEAVPYKFQDVCPSNERSLERR